MPHLHSPRCVCACRGYIFQQASTTTSTDTLQASWDNFTDPQSYVSGYVVQFFQQVRGGQVSAFK